MEKRERRISFKKSGSGSMTPFITLPTTWVRDMNINTDVRDVTLTFSNNIITIENNSISNDPIATETETETDKLNKLLCYYKSKRESTKNATESYKFTQKINCLIDIISDLKEL